MSIKNHVYWCATSSTTGPEKVAKWTSLLNHLQNVHDHEDPLFPKCLHPERASRDPNKWLQPGMCQINITQKIHSAKMMPLIFHHVLFFHSRVSCTSQAEKLLLNKRVLKDVAKLSHHHQTSSLESFHSLILRFAPKNVVFPFMGMLCR